MSYSDRIDELSRVMKGDRPPLASQIIAAEKLSAQGRLIARLPTGAGKTLLAGLPFAAGLLCPKQMIFMTPLRTLSGAQTRALTDQIDGDAASIALQRSWEVREQTGNVPGDPLFEASTVVCTFDQALSAALQIGYSVPARRRTINAGAILPAYLVADELHLFPRDEAFTTLLWLLRHRPPELPFCLMTATLSAPMARHLAELLDADILDQLPAEDVASLELTNRTRTVQWQDRPIDAEQIATLATEHEQVLIVVNTVNRAIELGREVRQLIKDRPVWVLHSRFYKEDRDAATRQILAAFGREPEGRKPAVVIATQVIEAGLDLSSDVLLTELAPANALVQRWGRCARWGGEGAVIVAPPPNERVYPYAMESGGADLINRTSAWLQAQAGYPIPMDERTEQEFLDAAHAEADARWLDGLSRALADRSGTISKAIGEGNYALAGELIRNVQQRTVLVHGAPEDLGNPARCEGFGLSYGTLLGIGRNAGLGHSALRPDMEPEDEEGWGPSIDLPDPPEWVFQLPVWNRGTDGSERRADEPSEWRQVESLSELHAAPIVAINPALVQYDPLLGLELRPGVEPAARPFWARLLGSRANSRARYGYRRETYSEHVERMLRVLGENPALWPRVSPLATTIEDYLGWPAGMLQRVIRATVVLHDAGKLTPKWQSVARAIQHQQNRPVQNWLVHTDSQPDDPATSLRFPPHAFSGAAHGLEVAVRLDEELAAVGQVAGQTAPSPGRVLFTAIATHHNPSIKDLLVRREALLDDAASAELRRVLAEHALPAEVAVLSEGPELSACLVPVGSLRQEILVKEVFALAIVTRLLRLADGWSQERTREETNANSRE